MTIGVYIIKNTVNGRFYVGSSKRCETRFREHRNALMAGRHHCRALQSAWKAHGQSAFEFTIIVCFREWADAVDHEQLLLNEWHGQRICLNSSGDAGLAFRDPEVMARARAARQASEHYKAVRRKVCIDRNADPEFQRRAADAVRSSKKHREAVTRNAMTILQRPEVIAKSRASIKANGRQAAAARAQVAALNTPEMKARTAAITSKAVRGTNIETGECLTFPSQSAAARAMGVNPSNISHACRGLLGVIKGYRWVMT